MSQRQSTNQLLHNAKIYRQVKLQSIPVNKLNSSFEYNDVELYDLATDPDEMQNLAVDKNANGDLLLAMNQKMTDTISGEVGGDEGEFLPENKAGWSVTRLDP